jgi:riboflavin kinase/FMN adenylyltransferase
MEGYGIEYIRVIPVTVESLSTSWLSFLEQLVEEGAAGFVCGGDFHFGHRGEGNSALLQTFCRDRNLPCCIVPDQTLQEIRISSTYIRRQIELGDMETAVRFLGHPYLLTGTVVHGRQIGRKLGMPTANLVLPEGLALPKLGVYACVVQIGSQRFPAVTNIGLRPTVGGQGITVEPWILDFSGDLYGKEITLEFYYFLRPEQKFPDLTALQQQIARDGEQTRRYLEEHL